MITFEPIGIVHAPIADPKALPNFYSVSDIPGTIEIYPPFVGGLEGLEEYDYIVVLFHFHLARGYELRQRRKGTGPFKGVFSLCSPNRPNGIGMSILKLERVEGALLFVRHLDMADATPILDIKPYKPEENPQGRPR